MIVRLLNEGQYRIDESLHARLNELDDRAVQAVDDGNEDELDMILQRMWDLVQSDGERVPDDELAPSDLVIPPADLTLEETRQLFSEDGLIPDLPAA
jgi:PspA-Associated protein